ncbi:MAG: response regulator [Cyanobacteria bacterium P01_A01_bin.17]
MSAKLLFVYYMQAELDLLCQYLKEEGYTIVTAVNGAEALEKVRQNKPDAIVTDWMMPEMGGLDLARKLRKDPETADIPVVACTAKDRDVDRMWAAKQGVEAYVTKPCTKQELVSALRAAMN